MTSLAYADHHNDSAAGTRPRHPRRTGWPRYRYADETLVLVGHALRNRNPAVKRHRLDALRLQLAGDEVDDARILGKQDDLLALPAMASSRSTTARCLLVSCASVPTPSTPCCG